MLIFPNAKVNFGLFITEKREDGFHNLSSCFYPVPWEDVLEITPSDKYEFKSTGLPIEGDPKYNLVNKAYQLVKNEFDIPPVKIHLQKNIPMGAGLGGGSADGAFMLKGLNELFELNYVEQELEDLAGKLGSDCPFFIRNETAIASEKGNELQPFPLVLSGIRIVIVYPGIHIPTAEAYRNVRLQAPELPLENLLSQPMSEWRNALKNSFEESVFQIAPEIGEIKQKMYDHGAIFSSMTGSGSAVFAIFSSIPEELQFPDHYLTFQHEL